MSKEGKLRQAADFAARRREAKESGNTGEFRSLAPAKPKPERTHVLIVDGYYKTVRVDGRRIERWLEVNPVDLRLDAAAGYNARAQEAFGHLNVNIVSGTLTYRKDGKLVRYQGKIKLSNLKNPGGRK
jgi:hypothetical protein